MRLSALVLAVCLAWAAPVAAQTPSVGSQNFADATLSDTPLTLATVASGNTIIAAYLKTSASNRTVTVTDSVSSSYSLVASIGTCTAAACIEIYMAHNVAGAGGTVTVTFDQSSTLASYAAQVLEVECSSVCSTDTFSSLAESATTSHVCSADATVIDTAANVLVYAAAGLAGNLGTDTAGSGYAEGTDSSTSKFFQWRVSDTALTNERGSWTSSNSVATSCVIVSVKITTVVTPPPSAVYTTRNRFSVLSATPVNPNPQPIIIAPTSQATYGTSSSVVTISGTCSDDNACTAVTYACTGASACSGTATGTASWSLQVTLSAGTTTVTVTAADAEAHTATDAIAITYTASDATAPVATITSPTSGTTYTASASPLTVSGTATDAVGVVSVAWVNAATVANGPCTAGTGTSVTFTCLVPLNTGSNALTITACDQAANCGTDTLTVTLTLTISIDQTSLQDGTSTVAYSRQLTATGGTGSNTWTNNGAGTTVNDGDSDCSGITISSGGLVAGTHTGTGTCSFVAKVTDAAMNTDTQALSLTFVASGAETSHQYFNALCALAEKIYCYSLRVSDASLSAYGNASGYFHYYTGAGGDVDGYSDPQDALKLTWPANDNSLETGQQLRFPINQTSGTLQFGWDAWYGPEWRMTGCGGVIQTSNGQLTHKQYQLGFGESGAGTGSITVELRHKYDEASTCASNAALDNRMYTSGNSSTTAPVSGVTSDLGNSFAPGGEGAVTTSSLMQPHSTWIRHIVEVKLNAAAADFTSYNAASGGTVSATPSPGLYHMVSWWVCSETTDCQRLAYKVPIRRQVNGTANGHMRFTGTAGTVIPLGTVLTHPTSGVTYTTNAACTIEATAIAGNNNCDSIGGNTADVRVTATTFTEEGFLDTGGVMAITSPPAGLNATATALESIGADIRDGLSALWFEMNTSTNPNRASGLVTFTGTNGSTITSGTQIVKADGTRYNTSGPTVTISGGTATMPATATGSFGGPVGNADIGTTFTVTTPPAGVNNTATAATAFTGGSYIHANTAVSYYRNVWVLRNYTLPTVPEDDTSVFKRPVR